jgi:hypothetical protein
MPTKTTQKFMGRNQLIDRLAAQVGDRARAVAILQARGHLYPGTEKLTPAGRARDQMTAEERALDRAARATGQPASAFAYDPTTNRARIKNGNKR